MGAKPDDIREGRPHVVIIHRWRDQYAHYEEYLDHRDFAVSYITTDVGVAGVPARRAGLAIVTATDDPSQVRPAVRTLAGDHGAPAAIIAMKEDDLLIAAELREEWGCPGHRVADLLPFRDKYVMAQRIAEAGLAMPAFALAPDLAAIDRFAARHGWPVVVKPRIGSSSDAVTQLDSLDDLAWYRLPGSRPMMVEAFNPEQIYHVDGVFSGTELGRWRASRYVNTCLGFRTGDVLGSAEEDNEAVNAAIGPFANQVLRALTTQPVVFHLEVFVADTAGTPPSCSFLEVGARVGGAEIPFLWREVHGYDLMDAAFQIARGQPAAGAPEHGEAAPPQPAGDNVAGWLLVPAPASRPCRITSITPMVGNDPGPYAEALLPVGEILPQADAFYEHVGGRFRFRGPDSESVRKAITRTAESFCVAGQPVA